MNRIFYNLSGAEVSPDAVPQWAIKLTAVGAVLMVTLICVAARTLGPRAAVVFTTVKVRLISNYSSASQITSKLRLQLLCVFLIVFVALLDLMYGWKVFIIVLGLVQLIRGKASTSLTQPLFDGSSTSPSAYSLALYSGLWAFDGWDQANYVGGEIPNPEKNIPRAIHSSMAIVIVRQFHFTVRFLANNHHDRSCSSSPTFHTL